MFVEMANMTINVSLLPPLPLAPPHHPFDDGVRCFACPSSLRVLSCKTPWCAPPPPVVPRVRKLQLLYVGLPVLVVGVLDQDISAAECLQFPAVYHDGIVGRYINNRQFLRWFLAAAAEAAVLCFIPMTALPYSDLDGAPDQ
jgi:hypothetical protein